MQQYFSFSLQNYPVKVQVLDHLVISFEDKNLISSNLISCLYATLEQICNSFEILPDCVHKRTHVACHGYLSPKAGMHVQFEGGVENNHLVVVVNLISARKTL